MKKSSSIFISICFFVFVLFLIKSYVVLDQDFGWYLGLGKLIASSGIPITDPFSYTMPSYIFIDHEWLANLITYFLYQGVGWTGLAILFSGLATFAVVLPFLVRTRKFNFLPILLGTGYLVLFIGIRMQVVTLLFFSILITVLFNEKIYKRFKYFLPLLFLIWANLHGGFAMGIFTYFLYLISDFIKTRKINYTDWSIFLLSFLFTFINPYRWGIWQEVFRVMTDSTLRWTISDWMPGLLAYHPILWIIIILSGYLIIKYRSSFSLFEKLLYFVLLIMGFLSVRHITIWVITALPLMHKGILVLEKEAGKIKFGKKRIEKAYSLFLGLMMIFVLSAYILGLRDWYFLGTNNRYPTAAVEYLSLNQSSGQIFSIYDWGGYLIWNLPEKKVFIDGRMPTWKRDGVLAGESENAHKEYRDIIDGKMEFSDVASKYNIDTVFLPVGPMGAQGLIKKTRQNNYEILYSQLKKSGWELVYKDNLAVIYRRPN